MEKVPRKKGRAPVKKPVLLLILLLCAALCAGAAYFVRRPQDYGEPQAAERTYLLDRPTEEIASVAIAPAGKTAYPLVRGADGRMCLSGQESQPLRESVVNDLLLAAAQVEAVGTLLDTEQNPVSLSDFGLSPASLRLVVGYTDGEKRELLFGDPIYGEEDNPAYYCMRGGDPHIYQVLAAPCNVFFHEVDYLRDFTQPSLDGSLLDSIRVAGETALQFRYTPMGWQMEEPVRYPVQDARMNALLTRIGQMGFEAYLGAAAEPDVSRCGLDHPTHVITLVQAPTTVSGITASGEQASYGQPAVTYTLSLGADEGDSALYVLWKGGIYKASRFLFDFWRSLMPDEFWLRTPVNFLTNQLTRLTVERGGETRVYDFSMVESIGPDNQVETDEYGETLYDVEIRRDGVLLDTQAFLSWYTALAELSPAGRLPGDTAAGEPLLRLTLESEPLTRVVTLYPYDALHCVMDVDGTRLFYTDREYLKNFDACP